MPRSTAFDLDTKTIGALPLVNHLLHRLRLEELLDKHLPPPGPGTKLPAVQTLGLLVRNLVLARAPLYGLAEWARDRIPSLLGLAPEQIDLLNDDRVGRALDRLFDADRSALLTDLVVRMVQDFDVCLDQLHNDSTTLSVHGEYPDATGRPVRGKPTLAITFGHSKDHRPDLKQLLWILTVSADGAIPVHFKVADGNTEDSTTHVETWNLLRALVGSADFLYVADSKLCTRENLKHIQDNGGRFITVLPRTRKEDGLFKDWLQDHTPAWEEVLRRPDARRKNGPPDIFGAIASPIPDADGFRVIWYQSSHKMERDAQFRRNAIQSAGKDLDGLEERLQGPRPRFQSQAGVAKVVEEILQGRRAARWITYEVTTVQQEVFRQEKRGRPGKNTRWRRRLKTRFQLRWELNKDTVDYDAKCDGVFPLITNRPKEELSAADVLEAYKCKQPLVEKRHDLLKNVEAATPLYLKSVSRIEALLFLLFVALLVHALIEREVRRAMAARGLTALAIYPEGRLCTAPSTARILEVFEDLQRHLLLSGNQVVQRFDPELRDRQLEILDLLQIPPTAFIGR